MSVDPMRIGHPDKGFNGDTCGCCEGTALATMAPIKNRPNLSAIAFRVGDHAAFKASMLTNLASSAHTALAELTTREDDDFSIALIDAWATVCDVLTFYQERLANEAYIGTATERLSIAELARLIGYRLLPGAAAETELVLLMEDPPGATPDVVELSVPLGTRVQSQPGPAETAQVFETIEEFGARVAWNSFRPRLTEPVLPSNDDVSTWVAGTPSLQPGEALLFLPRERWDEGFTGFDEDTPLWDFRRVTAVEPSADGTRTQIRWDTALDSVDSSADGPTAGLKLFQLRDRAGLFGYNAPHPLVLSADQRANYGFGATDTSDWTFTFTEDTRIHLDNIYKSFTRDSWMMLTAPNGLGQSFRITATADDTLAKYAISGKAQRLDLDTSGSNLALMASVYRGISAYGGSVEIPLVEAPIETWVAGDEIDLDNRVDALPEGRKLILRGKLALLKVTAQEITLTADDGAARLILTGDVVTLLDAPKDSPSGGTPKFRLRDATGFVGTADAQPDYFTVLRAPKDAEDVVVAATVKSTTSVDPDHTRLNLSEPLGVALDRRSLTIHANVVRAAHGEGVTQILGHGDPSQPFQKFLLKQAPVTQRLARAETGIKSTLSVRIDGVEWTEVPDLYQRGPAARVYKTTLTGDGETLVEFGDGLSGARPPAGRDNIVAEFSRGLGAAGNLRAGQLKLPLDRPLGLKDVVNPLPATGGANAQTPSEARRNAPIYALTLGRVVSLTDYRDFALGFPGIAKAEARWVWQGETRRIVVTVAGDGGSTINPGHTTYDNLLDTLHRLGDPLASVELLSYAPASFRLGLRVKVDGDYDHDAVLADTEAHLRAAFSFEIRDFGQILSLSEVAATAHKVPGLVAVDIDLLYRTTPPQTAHIAHSRLVSQTGRLGPDGTLLPAEILMLHDGPFDKLQVMA